MAVTMKDIARVTGLGLATISKYYNGGSVRAKNQKLIEDAARSLGYVPNEIARSLKTKHTYTIGVVIPELSNVFITSIISTMEDLLRQKGYAVIVCDCRSNPELEKEAVSFLLRKQVDGLINMPYDVTGDHLRPAIEAGTPVVLVDRILKPLEGQVPAVVLDNVDAAEQGTRFLLQQGHRNIGLVLGDRGFYTTECRLQGYLNAFSGFDVPVREENIRCGNYTMNGGYTAAKQLLALPEPPTALFVTNFEMTLGVMLALREAGIRIPEDLSVMGFDKMDLFGEIFPDLTLVRQPQDAIGLQTARLMLELLSPSGNTAPGTITLSAQLHRGKSTRELQNP